MNKLDKLNRIKEVGEKIWYRDDNKVLTETENLEYFKMLESDLPILMFLLDDQDVPVLNDHRMEYIYYLPDLYQIRCESVYVREEDYETYKEEEYFLPDTLDLREKFAYFNISSLFKNKKVNKETNPYFFASLEILKSSIDEIFKNNDVSSWDDVRNLLVNSKGLKLERIKE